MDLPICAVCKHKKDGPCTLGQPCFMAPYFPSTEPEKFARVCEIFGLDKVCTFMNQKSPQEREDAANALCYAAEARKNDPILGYVAMQRVLEKNLIDLKKEIESAENELAMITMGAGSTSNTQDAHPFPPNQNQP